MVSACAPAGKSTLSAEQRRTAAQGLTGGELLEATARMDPAIQALARRHDPSARRADLWGRPAGWGSFDLRTVPDLGLAEAPPQTAEQVNALRPFARLPIRPMRPFVLKTDAEDKDRALRCLAQAVYYEAAREPLQGQQAVAQVVLNRVRHPAYPKSICGVVYQGAARPTGCQFTFTCDGALRWAPQPALWNQAMAVAKRAAGGYVDRDVGSATHYHANYVMPYWAPTLVKMTQVGAHIFYRWTGPWGEPAAFVGRYAGREAVLTPQLLASGDPRMQGLFAPEAQGVPPERKVTLAVAGDVRTYTVADPAASGGQRTRVIGTLQASRRQPTADQVRAINESLAGVERRLKAVEAPDATASPVLGAAPAPTEPQPVKAAG
jgi:hypothetical protein